MVSLKAGIIDVGGRDVEETAHLQITRPRADLQLKTMYTVHPSFNRLILH
jgi:hypothetical protein